MCQQGTIGTQFFIILTGTAGVYVHKTPDPTKAVRRLTAVSGDVNVGPLVAKILQGACAPRWLLAVPGPPPSPAPMRTKDPRAARQPAASRSFPQAAGREARHGARPGRVLPCARAVRLLRLRCLTPPSRPVANALGCTWVCGSRIRCRRQFWRERAVRQRQAQCHRG